MVSDKIAEIVERAIAYTEEILQEAPQHYQIALDGLERMLQNLIARRRGPPGAAHTRGLYQTVEASPAELTGARSMRAPREIPDLVRRIEKIF